MSELNLYDVTAMQINETLYLLSIPRMKESIKEGVLTEMDNCDTDLDWLLK